MWRLCCTVSAMELIFFCWNIERLVVTRRQMPDVEYSARLLVSSVFQWNIWVWPFCLLTGDFFCLPLLQKWGCVMLQEAVTWHLVLSLALSGENEKCDTWWRNLPQHIWVDKVKSRKDICNVDVLQLPLCTLWKILCNSERSRLYQAKSWLVSFYIHDFIQTD